MSGKPFLFADRRTLLLLLLPVLSICGCHWGEPRISKLAYVPPPEISSPETIASENPEETASAEKEASLEETGVGALPGKASHAEILETPKTAGHAVPREKDELRESVADLSDETDKGSPPRAPEAPREEKGRGSMPGPLPAKKTNPSIDRPAWANGKEELAYRVEFLGMTMGYARFTYKGKALLKGKEAYHLSVRAWTTDVLSLIYPINETIDYYMDVNTLEPLQVDYSGNARKPADTAFYDQKNGKIVYRYRSSGEIRKQVDLVPSIFDPVTVAYYFRAKDLGNEGRPRNVYGGRKLYQISSRMVGREKIETVRGPIEAIVIQPVIKRDGKLDDKGDLRMWMTDDALHVPIRIYAKFKKIRTWSLYAELVPKEGA